MTTTSDKPFGSRSDSRFSVLNEVHQRLHDMKNLQRAGAWPHVEGVARAEKMVWDMIVACQPKDSETFVASEKQPTLDRDQIIERVEGYFSRVRKLGGDTGECSEAGIADFLLYDAPEGNFHPAVTLSPDKNITASGVVLEWGPNQRDGKEHIEWHAPCGCAWHPDPAPHWHPCALHRQGGDKPNEVERLKHELAEAYRLVCPGNGDEADPVRCQSFEASEQGAPCPPGCCVMADEKDVRAVLAAIEREDGAAPSAIAPSEAEEKWRVVEQMLLEFPSGHDEYGVYTDWKEKLDTALRFVAIARANAYRPEGGKAGG